MHPVLFQCGPFTLYTFGVCFAVGVLLGAWVAGRQARRERDLPLPADAIGDLLLAVVLGGVVGGRLLYILLHWPDYAAHPWEMIALWHGGLVFYGGFAGGLLAAYGFLHRRLAATGRWSLEALLRVIDLLMPSLALAQSVGRLGCFFNGCCYGRLALYPPQVLESLGTLVLFVILRVVQIRQRAPWGPGLPARGGLPRQAGLLTGLYLVLYGTMRFAIEFLRGDNPRWWLGLTLSQWLGLLAVPLGGWLLWRPRHGHVLPIQRR